MSVVEAASKLFDLLAAQDTTFTRHLLPGISRADIHVLVDPLGVVLPEEALQFYEHFSLPPGYQYEGKQATFFGIYWMLGLEDAIKQYHLRDYAASCTQEDEFVPGENEGSGGWFPFLEAGGDFYLLDTTHAGDSLCPVIGKLRDGGPQPEFVSMTAMFETMYDWVTEGVLTVKDGHLLGDYEGDPVKVGHIASWYNPGISSWQRMASGEV